MFTLKQQQRIFLALRMCAAADFCSSWVAVFEKLYVRARGCDPSIANALDLDNAPSAIAARDLCCESGACFRFSHAFAHFEAHTRSSRLTEATTLDSNSSYQ